eukprot:5750026-Alexandrium_andersonii.AAC.1
MRCLTVLSGPGLLMRARRLIGNSSTPRCLRRLARSSHRVAQPLSTISSKMPEQTSASSSADR